jgi:hypothetical protein
MKLRMKYPFYVLSFILNFIGLAIIWRKNKNKKDEWIEEFEP